jgi:hypothetical protein
MKAKLALVVVLVAVLALAGVGCNKVTGGGWFIDTGTGNKITIGFNAQPTGVPTVEASLVDPITAKGQFELIDHDSKTRVHGSFEGTYASTGEGASYFEGTCSVNGGESESFWVLASDDIDFGDGPVDSIEISIGDGHLYYNGVLQGGNIQVH